jgi:hypothetical protein
MFPTVVREFDNVRSDAQALQSAGKAPPQVVKRPRSDRGHDAFLGATMVTEWSIRAVRLELAGVLGNDWSTPRIIGVIGIACGKPFFVRLPSNSITSALISSRANSVTSLRRAPDSISNLTRAPAAPPSASADFRAS